MAGHKTTIWKKNQGKNIRAELQDSHENIHLACFIIKKTLSLTNSPL